MLKTLVYAGIGVFFYAFCSGAIVREALAAPSAHLKKPSTLPRHIRYSFTIRNTRERVLPVAELWVYAPQALTATQQRVSLDSSHPFTEITDTSGNTILHLVFEKLPPYATQLLTIEADLLLTEYPLPLAEAQSNNRQPNNRQSLHEALRHN